MGPFVMRAAIYTYVQVYMTPVNSYKVGLPLDKG